MAKPSPEESSLRPQPHAVGPEKSVLSSLMTEPERCFRRARELGVTEASFHLPGHALLFTELEKAGTVAAETDLVALIHLLEERSLLDRIGGPAAVTDIYTYAPSSAGFDRHVDILREKEVQRAMLRHFREGIEAVYEDPAETRRHLERVTEALRGLTSIRGSVAKTLRERAGLLRYDAATVPPGEEVCLLLGDVPVAARGNLTVIQGKSKVGKSAVVSAILGAVQASAAPEPGDCLGFRWQEREGEVRGAILHLDTEQSPADWHALVTRGARRAGLAVPLERLISLPLVTFSRGERLALLRELLEHERDHGNGTEVLVIDGVADLCISPNDEAEGLELVSRLMALAQEFGIAIVLIIHENPGTDTAKTRGHLGSELNRKAFANLRIDKDASTGLSVIYGTDMRKRDIPQNHGFCFGWDDAARMHVYKGRNATMKAEMRERDAVTRAREEWERIFEKKGKMDGFPFLTVRDAIELERDIKGKAESTTETTMKKRLQRGEVLGILEKTARGIYKIKPKGKTGHQRESE